MNWRALILVLAFTACETESTVEDVQQIALRVNANGEWQRDAKRCPAELIPTKQDLSYLSLDHCRSPRLQQCLKSCEAGRAGSCYWLAYALQSKKVSDTASEALYQRACRLGIVSGCTNRAAGMLHLKEPIPRLEQCAASTFSKACDLDDPWACTMFAQQLIRGAGVEKNDELALRVLEKSCKYGSEDPACVEAMQLKAELLKNLPP
jgi:hypothetical protein